ncbi:nuclear pore complex protein Nup50 [Anopheles darlingi]|uniref:nuclear pore complex protein Nup50 n=1 Tax=Anopheles darlingi TaxID=43151 RepID=UPI0021000AC7|nr:nuclear pore complex protein Nup50 [Anopheles darlingi]
MAKRGPQSALNHLNWDEEEKTEEVGEFAKASEDVLKQRVIKKARRRMDGAADADSTAPATSSIFGAFKGFAPAPAAKTEDAGTKTAAKPFSFLSGLATGAAKPNGNTAVSSSAASSLPSTTPMFSFGSNAGPTLTDASKKFTFGSPASLQPDKSTSEAAAGSKPSSGFSFLSPKTDTEGTNKNLFGMGSPSTIGSTFSFGAAVVTKADTATTAPTTSLTSSGSDTKPTFSFGSIGAAKKDETGVKPTFSFGSIPSPTAAKAADSSTKIDSPATNDDSKAPAEKKVTYSFGMPSDSKENVPLGMTPAAAKPSFSFGTAKESSAETVKKMFSFMDNKSSAGDADSTKKSTFSFGTLPQKKDDGADDGKKPTTGFSFGTLPKPASSSADTTDAAAKKTVFSGFGITPNKESAGSAEGTKKTFSFGSLPPNEPPSPVATKSSPFGGLAGTTFGTKPATTDKDKEDKFKKQVVALNKSFVAWITQNVEKNPFCKLHVVFRDYEKHFTKLESDKGPSTTPTSTTIPANTTSDAKPEEKKDKEENKKKEEATTDTPKEVAKPMFSFGSLPKEPLAKVSSPAPGGFTFGASKPFSFGSPLGGIGSTTSASNPTANSTPVSTFSPSFFAGASTFGSKPAATTGFTFGNVAPPASTESKAGEGDGEDGDDEPPKVEFTPVEEKDSVYSKRCKLFVKAGGNYSDRGIGTVHIKLVDTKVQVLVRADTSLGNVLLNIILNDSIPLQRMGKNNVMMICLPTPDSKPPPTSVLLRVKTAEEADELFETLKKHKSK